MHWLHERGYTYNGDANLSRLTPAEVSMLELGFLVQKEQEQKAQERAQSGDRPEQYRRKQGRTARGRQQFVETGSVG